MSKHDDLYMTVPQTITLLERIRDHRLSLPVVAVDSDTIGDKHTHCNWGLCTVDAEIITPDMRHWPDEEIRNNEARPKYHRVCHFDTTEKRTGKNNATGCFYRCRVFQHGLKDPEEARRLIEIRLTELRDEHDRL